MTLASLIDEEIEQLETEVFMYKGKIIDNFTNFLVEVSIAFKDEKELIEDMKKNFEFPSYYSLKNLIEDVKIIQNT